MSDAASAIPVDTIALSAAGMFPVGMVDTNHLLLLADDVESSEVEALALSQSSDAGWVGAARLQMFPGVSLMGPWEVGAELRELFELPDWVSQIMVLDCPHERAGALPAELQGTDPLSDAFPQAQPTGVELQALRQLLAIARRLAGAIRTADNGTIVTPDPARNIAMSVYAPVWLAPDGLLHLLQPLAPGLRSSLELEQPVQAKPRGFEALPEAEQERLLALLGADSLEAAWKQQQESLASYDPLEDIRDSYGVFAPLSQSRSNWGQVTVTVSGAERVPLAVAGAGWGDGVIVYEVRWEPQDLADAHVDFPAPSRRPERREAAALIERLTLPIVQATGGLAVDDDDFLIAL